MDQTQTRSADVYARTYALDDRTLAALVERLEGRGAHPFFQAAMDAYLAALAPTGGEALLDLGCGTGVAARRIAARPGWRAPITAVDISPALLEAGRRFAEAEGVADRIVFRPGDAHASGLPDASFDIVVMHTLLSHVASPAAVLAEGRRLLRAGGRLVVFDPDIASLAFVTEAEDGGAATDAVLRGVLGANPCVMRAMPRLLAEAGFSLESVQGHVAMDVGRVAFWASALSGWRVVLARSGAMSEPEADAFVGALEAASAANRFFGGCNFYTYLARAA